MTTLRYSMTKTYSEADSKSIAASPADILPTDPSHSYTLDSAGWFFRLIDQTAGSDGSFLTDEETDFSVSKTYALYADFSDNAAGVQLNGGTAGDVLLGGTARDRLIGGAGDDSLSGGRGSDVLSGGAGDDRLVGGGGRDRFVGGTGDDTIVATAKWAAIDGGKGSDTLVFRGGHGFFDPKAGSLTGIETVIVGDGSVLSLRQQAAIAGSIELDSKAGGGATVFGTNGYDLIIGGAGDDFITGFGGRDSLRGGAGADGFGYEAFRETADRDIIQDFSGHNGEGDLILINGRATTFVDRFTGGGDTEVRTETQSSGVQLVFVDADGNGEADFSIQVNARAPLVAEDFLLLAGGTPTTGGGFTPHPSFVEPPHPHDMVALV